MRFRHVAMFPCKIGVGDGILFNILYMPTRKDAGEGERMKAHDPKLSGPCPELLEAYADFCRETWGHVHDSYILHDPEKYGEWRHTIFEDYRRAEAGIGLPPGIVPSATYWIMDGECCVGVANIRPRLNEALEVYGGHIGVCIRPSKRGRGYARAANTALFAEAKCLGIRELLITCTADNLPSLRAIEAMPGWRIECDEIFLRGIKTGIRRYRRPLE